MSRRVCLPTRPLVRQEKYKMARGAAPQAFLRENVHQDLFQGADRTASPCFP